MGDQQSDPRLEVVLAESLRALTQQQAVLDNVRARASVLLSAAALVTSFFGPQVLSHSGGRLRLGAVVAIAALLLVTLMTGAVIWPRWTWRFRTSPAKVLAGYVDADRSVDDLRRGLALTYESYVDHNDRSLAVLQWAFVVGMAALVVEVVAWLVELTGT